MGKTQNIQNVDDVIFEALAFEPDYSRAIAIETENAKRLNAHLPAGVPPRDTSTHAIKTLMLRAAISYSNEQGISLTKAAQAIYTGIITMGVREPSADHINRYIACFAPKAAPK